MQFSKFMHSFLVVFKQQKIIQSLGIIKKLNSQQKSNYLEDLKIFEQKVENVKLLIKNSEDQRFFYKNQIENYLILGYISDIDMKNRKASEKNFKGPSGNKELKGIYLKDNNF